MDDFNGIRIEGKGFIACFLLAVLASTVTGWTWCYSCQGSGPSTDCQRTPAHVVHGPGRLNCSHDLCVTQRDEKNGAVFAFYRGCVYRPQLVSSQGSACTISHEGEMRNCVTYCNTTLCNTGNGLPEDTEEKYFVEKRRPRRPRGRGKGKKAAEEDDDDSIGGFFRNLFKTSGSSAVRASSLITAAVAFLCAMALRQ